MSRERVGLEQGYIMEWLVTRLEIQPYTVKRDTDDQLLFEKHMRECVAVKTAYSREEAGAVWDLPMQYLVNHNNWFVDFSEFYHLTKKIEMNAKTILVSGQAQEIPAVLWTFAAVQVYINGQCVCQNDTPVYKPMIMKRFSMNLKSGENQILVRMQNLGVRDTRNIFGIQIPGGNEGVHVRIPHIEGIEQILAAKEYLDTVSYCNKMLIFKEPAVAEILIKEKGETVEAGFCGKKTVEGVKQVTLVITAGGQEIARTIEASDQIKPLYLEDESRNGFFTYIGNMDPSIDHEAEKFTIYLLLARYATGDKREHDSQMLLQQLELLNTRIDCADFIVNGFLRFMNCYELDEEVNRRAKEVLLNFRYWMNEDGEDGMCFWSENHSILFYSALLLAAKQYPDDVFVRSGRTGNEQYAIARKKVLGWLEEVEEWGFEEFLSGGYTVVTVAALLNLVDFAEDHISRKAAQTIDKILVKLSMHTYKGSVIAPEGRIYRDVIYPFAQGMQGLVHYINPQYPVSSNIWLSCFATTKYQMPDRLAGLMETPCLEIYETGNALITLNKQKDYILTSAASPREAGYIPWQNNSFDPDADRNSVRYTKSINERFHGTTYFQPGVYGYQQHLWYAALDSECVVFTNHPGENTDRSSMRPAYWYGNGIIPAIRQKENCLGVVYQIPEHYPIHFTHLYFPESKFDEVRKEDRWVFAQKGDGYLAIWSDQCLAAHDDLLLGCEYRAYGSRSAFVCICGSGQEYGSFEGFIKDCKKQDVSFDEDNMQLCVGEKISVKFEEHHNKTQYI